MNDRTLCSGCSDEAVHFFYSTEHKFDMICERCFQKYEAQFSIVNQYWRRVSREEYKIMKVIDQ